MDFVESLIIFILIATFFVYSFFNLHENNKFMNFWQILLSFGTIFFAYSTFINMQTNAQDLLYKKDTFNKSIFVEFFNKNTELFIKYPSLDYYYAELNGLKYDHKFTRNKLQETQISFIMLSTIAIIIYTLNNNFTNMDKVKEKFNLILKTYFKSQIFYENYLLYKKKYGTELFNSYMHEYFNI
jgi:uncharacterized membrane protein YbhN (UPF0104 family)